MNNIIEKQTIIIAEVGSVHDGSFGNATKLIEAAAQAGADIVKFQTHISSAETLRDAPMPPYFKGEPRYEYFERTGFTLKQWKELAAHAAAHNIEFISSPFSIEAIELLEQVGITRYKVPSGEVTNLPMLDLMAQTGKPIILSSGMSSWRELDEAVATIRKHNNQLTILQCTSAYPCPYEQVGLNVMIEMKERYGLDVGLSDHTMTIYTPIVAVSLGAKLIEKHFTFSRLMYGSDAKHSLEPDEFSNMVAGIRAAEILLGSSINKDDLLNDMQGMKHTFEKSVVSIKQIPAGATITRDMLGIKKPGTGIPARDIDKLIGCIALQDIPTDSLINWDTLKSD